MRWFRRQIILPIGLLLCFTAVVAEAGCRTGYGRIAEIVKRDDKTRALAKEAGLVVLSYDTAGIQRVPRGRGFGYFWKGRALKDQQTKDRIAALMIPPVWEEVWIARNPRSHIQATGLDSKGRTQYLYHARYKEKSARHKYDTIIHFGQIVGKLRKRAWSDLHSPALSRRRVLAGMLLTMDHALMRVGNANYREKYGTFGLTTLQKKHVRVRGHKIAFDFLGKHGIRHVFEIEDARLARLVKALKRKSGRNLFRYRNERGRYRDLTSVDFNDYINEIGKNGFSAKNFRTWWATVMAARELADLPIPENGRQLRRNIKAAMITVSEELGNTPNMARKMYVHPRIVEAYEPFIGKEGDIATSRGTTLQIIDQLTHRVGFFSHSMRVRLLVDNVNTFTLHLSNIVHGLVSLS